MTRKIYIAGPMAGYENHNFDAFNHAAISISFNANIPISPAAVDMVFEGWQKYPPKDFRPTHADRVRFIRRDLNAILDLDPKTDSMFMLEGWVESKGANVEHALAKFLGLKIEYQ